MIMRPGTTTVSCGKAGDSAGTCHVWRVAGGTSWCPSAVGVPAADPGGWGAPGDTCGKAWRPEDIGTYLHRLTTWQQHHGRLFYNEIVVDSAAWREELPWTIEAFYGQTVIYQRFLDHFRGRLTKHEVPHVALDPSDWHAPFRISDQFEGFF